MGGSSRGGGRTPVEVPESGRSKQRIKLVEVISEGEIGGLVEGLKSVFLDNTPVQARDGSYHFANVDIEGRAGTQDQAIMPDFNTVEKETSVATEVKKNTPITRTITDSKVNRIRMTLGVQALFSQNEQGDTNSTSVELKITVGTRVIPFTISGKYSNPYSRAFEITDLPPVPFTIKVERITPESKSNRLVNKTTWASYTEIIESQFAYPNTAYVGVKFDSEYFNSVPTRSYEIYGIKVRVPSNYDPVARTYTGLWDGSFKIAYTDNPAWVLMDIITNKRYGLGDRLGEFNVDKWALYQIAQYCDQKIPNGFGGVEPRFTCNLWITEQRSAYDVLSDLCSIFRAMPVWNGTELTFLMDRPSDPVWTYTNANVINGEFSRQYSAMKARHNAVQVEYQDASNHYEKSIEYVSDDEQIRQYGLNLKKVKAYGCTSRGQAFRTGKWILETEKRETETITFTVGSEGLMNIPGDIIRVTDNHYAGTNIGGRVVAIQGNTVTLDRDITLSGQSYLSFINAQAKHSNIKIRSAHGNVVTLESTPTGLTINGVWSLTTQQIASRLYRCMSISENNEEGTYTITALQHEPQKEAIVDNGANFEPINTTLLKPPMLESADISGTESGGMRLAWATTSGIGTLTYDIKLLKAGKLYQYYKGLTSTEFAFEDLPNGEYLAIILAKNASGQIVSEKSQSFTIDRPPVPTEVNISGGLTAVVLSWGVVNDATFTEIWASESDNLNTAIRIAKVNGNTYSHEIGAKQVRYYWLRHVRGQNNGLFYQARGLKAETGADIDAELSLLNEKLGKNLIAEVFDTAMPARKLELTLTVPKVTNPSEYKGHKQLYNEADGKLWVWNGRKYEANNTELLASVVKGILQPNQLASIPTSKLTGQISNAQIAQISGEKIAGKITKENLPKVPTMLLEGVVTNDQIQAIQASKVLGSLKIEQVPTIPTSKLTGLVSNAQIENLNVTKLVGLVSANQLAQIPTGKITGRFSDSQIAQLNASKLIGTVPIANVPPIPTNKLSGTISDSQIDKINANKLTGTVALDRLPTVPTTKLSGKISDAMLEAVNASKIQGSIELGKIPAIPTSKLTGQVSASQIQANAIGANHIGANAITADKIAANSVNARALQANSVSATHLQANSVGTNHLIAQSITASKMMLYGENMVQDPLFADMGYWRENMNTAGQTENGVLRVNVVNKTGDTYIYGLRNRYNLPIDSGRSYRLQCRIKVTGDRSNVCHTSLQLCRFAAEVGSEQSTEWEGYGWSRTGKLGNRDELVSVVVPSTWFDDNKWTSMGVYLRIGTKDGNSTIANATVEFSQIELIKMADADLIVDGAISANKIQAGSITGDKVKANAITGDKISGNTITGDKLQSNSIESRHVKANTITGDKISGNAITGDKIAGNSITADKLQANSIDGSKIRANSIAANHIKAQAISSDKIATHAITSEKILSNSIQTAHIQANAINGDKIAGNTITGSKMQAGTLSAREIATNAITSEKILAGAVNAQKIASNVIEAKHIKANVIGTNHLQAGSIGAKHIQSNSIGASVIQANSIGANAIQASAIGADKLQTNAVTSAKIQAGAIRADHLQAGSISADKFVTGLGGNLISNAILANNGHLHRIDGIDGTAGGFSRIERQWIGKNTADWTFKDALPNETLLKTRFVGSVPTLKQGQWTDCIRLYAYVTPNKWYMFSAFAKGYRCSAYLLVEEYQAGNQHSYIKFVAHSERISDIAGDKNSGTFQHGVRDAPRMFVKFKAPASGYVMLAMRVDKWLGNNPDTYFARPMLEECTEHTREPSAWQNSGVTAIHGGSIETNTITAEKIGAGQITTNHMVAGTIDGKVLRAGSVTADRVVASVSLSSPKINGGTISGNTISGGSIKGTTITGTTIQGNTISGGSISGSAISGATINGGVIKGARIEGVTGRFTGELEVTKLIGGGVIEHVAGNLNFERSDRRYVGQEYGENSSQPIYVTSYLYSRNIHIQSFHSDRLVTVIGLTKPMNFILPANQERRFKIEQWFSNRNEGNSNTAFMVVAYAISTSRTVHFN